MMLNIVKINILATICILLTLFLSSLLKEKYSVHWKYWVWMIISVVVLFPFRLTEIPLLIEIKVPRELAFSWVTPLPEGETSITEYTNISSSVTGTSSADNVFQGGKESPFAIDNPDAEEPLSSGFPNGTLILNGVRKGIVFAWMGGMGVLFFFRMFQYSVVKRRLKGERKKLSSPAVCKKYDQVCRRLKVKEPPRLYVHAALSSPLLEGICKPCIYLPEKPYTPTELELIFLHELNHFQYKDIWYKLLLSIPRTVYWFNPAFSIMWKEASRDVEGLCDSRVMEGIGVSKKRIAYGRLLLCTAIGAHSIGRFSIGLNDSAYSFKERIQYMQNAGSRKKSRTIGLLLGASLLFLNQFVGCTAARTTETAGNNPAESIKTEVTVSNPEPPVVYDTDFFSFTLPEIWQNQVVVRSNKEMKPERLTIDWEGFRIATIEVEKTEYLTAGDIGRSMVWHSEDLNGYSVVLWSENYAYIIPHSDQNPDLLLQYLSAEQKEKLVYLSTGGRMSLQEAYEACQSDNREGETITAVSRFFTENIVPCIQLKKQTY